MFATINVSQGLRSENATRRSFYLSITREEIISQGGDLKLDDEALSDRQTYN
jgi:hypothetical protein